MRPLPSQDIKSITSPASTNGNQAGQSLQKRTDFVIFKTTPDVRIKPVLFIPEFSGKGGNVFLPRILRRHFTVMSLTSFTDF